MFKNYLKIALRHLYRHKAYTMVNVIGLAVGLSVCLIIGLFVRQELSFDRFHPNAGRVYRIVQNSSYGQSGRTPPGLAAAIESRFPEIEHATEVPWSQRALFRQQEKSFMLEGIKCVDENFFEVFPFPLVQGNPQTALAQPGQMIITRSLAKKLFGEENPIGKIMNYENQMDYRIVGLLEDVPANSHFRFEALLSLSDEQRKERHGSTIEWNFWGEYLYVQLHKTAEAKALEAKITEWAKAVRDLDSKDWGLKLQPLTSIHLHSTVTDEIEPQSDVRYLYFFSALALIILAVACINFANLATARSATRAGEIGVRKVVGASRHQLFRQFMGEAVMLCLLALPLALFLVEATLPAIKRWFNIEIHFGLADDPFILIGAAAITLLIGIASGCYPALFLSALRPVHILGRKLDRQRTTGRFRKTLVVTQFAVSMILLVSTLIIEEQLRYVQNKRLGFEKENVVTFSSHWVGKRWETFKRELLASPDIVAVASGPAMGIGHANMSTEVTRPGTQIKERLFYMDVDDGYIETLGLKLLAGRTFSEAYTIDERNAVVLNKAAANLLGFAGDPLGQLVPSVAGDKSVIGLVENFHNRSLHAPIQPMVFQLSPGANWTGLVRLHPERVSAGLAYLEKVWSRFVPDRPIEFHFVSDQIQRQYRSEQRLGYLFIIFATLAIFIACLGVFSLAGFMAEQRTKEIGIRKVLGASVPSIIGLLSKEFVQLVIVAMLIASPIAYFAMNRWLQDFAYRVEIGWWVFALAGGVALLIALLTVSTQAVKAALANPVEALRYE